MNFNPGAMVERDRLAETVRRAFEKLPDGWEVREPCEDGGYWRIVEHPRTPNATVVDGRPTRDAALRRVHEIVRNRDRVRRRFLEGR
jgi:hypothetical protein